MPERNQQDWIHHYKEQFEDAQRRLVELSARHLNCLSDQDLEDGYVLKEDVDYLRLCVNRVIEIARERFGPDWRLGYSSDEFLKALREVEDALILV